MRELFTTEIEEIKAKARDEGYQTGKSDAMKEAKMIVGTYGVKDIDSEETKIYIKAREEAVHELAKYEPHVGNWSWQESYKEIQSLQARNEVLAEAIKPFANFACDDWETHDCFNCIAKQALAQHRQEEGNDGSN